jgi:hypothetical protein
MYLVRKIFGRLAANQEVVLAPTSSSNHKSNCFQKDYVCYELISNSLHYKRKRERSGVMRKEVQVKVVEV